MELKPIVRDLPKNWISGKVGIEFSCFLLDLKHFKSLFLKKCLCKYLISQFFKECSWSFIYLTTNGQGAYVGQIDSTLYS